MTQEEKRLAEKALKLLKERNDILREISQSLKPTQIWYGDDQPIMSVEEGGDSQ